MPKSTLTFLGILLSVSLLGQAPLRMVNKAGNPPIVFIDSVNVEYSELRKQAPEEIASVTVYKHDDAMELMGEAGKDGIIYIETKPFARNRYWKYLKKKSREYSEIVQTSSPNEKIQYILNDKVLTENFEGELSMVDDKIFKGIEIFNKKHLKRKYKIKNKDYGIVITSEKRESLYKPMIKF